MSTPESHNLSEYQQKQISKTVKWLHDNRSVIGHIPQLIDLYANEEDLVMPEITELKAISEKTADLIHQAFCFSKENSQNTELYLYLESFRENIRQDIFRILASINNCHLIDSEIKDAFKNSLFPDESEELNPEQIGSDEISDIVSHLISIHGQGLNVTLDYDHQPVWIDRASFIRILINIFSNARKYTPVGTNVNIQVKQMTQSSLILITDDGPGFTGDPQKLMKMYAQDKPEHATQGYGIGLSYCHDVVQDHGGVMEIHNRRDLPGQNNGAMFVIVLPNSSRRQSQVTFKDSQPGLKTA